MATDSSVRRPLGLVVAAVASIVFVLWAAGQGAVPLWSDAGRPSPAAEVPSEPISLDIPLEPFIEPADRELPDLSWVGVVFGVIVALVLLAVLVALVRWLMTLQFIRRDREAPRVAGSEAGLPEIADAVRDAEFDLYAALRQGEPRNAIVACWVRLEAAVSAAGATPRPAETSLELTERVLGQFDIDSSALRDLAALYREARFSQHPLHEDHRDHAIRALRALAESLRQPDTEVQA